MNPLISCVSSHAATREEMTVTGGGGGRRTRRREEEEELAKSIDRHRKKSQSKTKQGRRKDAPTAPDLDFCTYWDPAAAVWAVAREARRRMGGEGELFFLFSVFWFQRKKRERDEKKEDENAENLTRWNFLYLELEKEEKLSILVLTNKCHPNPMFVELRRESVRRLHPVYEKGEREFV